MRWIELARLWQIVRAVDCTTNYGAEADIAFGWLEPALAFVYEYLSSTSSSFTPSRCHRVQSAASTLEGRAFGKDTSSAVGCGYACLETAVYAAVQVPA